MKRSTSLADRAGDDEQAVSERHQRLRRHAVDDGFLDAHHAVVRTRQAPEGPPEPDRQGAGDDAQRRLAPPQRFALLPELAAGAHHPAPHPGAAQPTSRRQPRTGAARRTAEATCRSSCAFSVCSTRTPPRLCPTKGRDVPASVRARSARNAGHCLRAGCGLDRRRRRAAHSPPAPGAASSAIAIAGIHSPAPAPRRAPLQERRSLRSILAFRSSATPTARGRIRTTHR